MSKFLPNWMGLAENLAFGSYQQSAGKMMVLQLLIDDGVADRGHRANILDPTYNTCGVATGVHTVYGSMMTIDYAQVSPLNFY